MTSSRGQAALRRKKGRDDTSWPDVNLIESKNKKNHVVDLVGTNG
jgi:hypothetical protein